MIVSENADVMVRSVIFRRKDESRLFVNKINFSFKVEIKKEEVREVLFGREPQNPRWLSLLPNSSGYVEIDNSVYLCFDNCIWYYSY